MNRERMTGASANPFICRMVYLTILFLLYWKYIIRECLVYGVAFSTPGCELGVDFEVGCRVTG
jgi:hypothetical protein